MSSMYDLRRWGRVIGAPSNRILCGHGGSSGSSSDENEGGGDAGGAPTVVEEVIERQQLKEPPRYACVLLNDDYTTMEFVVEILQRYFRKTGDEAAQIMLRVHHEGRGVAGVYSHEIAETKAVQVIQYARDKGYPLMCIVERAD